MFTEFKCGCIDSAHVGRVRICEPHRPEKADGSGNSFSYPTKAGVRRRYPAFGVMRGPWSGGK